MIKEIPTTNSAFPDVLRRRQTPVPYQAAFEAPVRHAMAMDILRITAAMGMSVIAGAEVVLAEIADRLQTRGAGDGQA